MQSSKLTAVIATAAMLTACSEPGGSGIMNGGSLNKQDVGTAVGAVAGGVVGYQFGAGVGQAAATIGGALLGGLLGNAIGKSMDNADRTAYDQASQSAMDSGERQSWKNSHSGHHGTITPGKEYTDDEGYTCREYTQSIYIGGKRHLGHGTACREEDGTWRIVE